MYKSILNKSVVRLLGPVYTGTKWNEINISYVLRTKAKIKLK